MGDLPLFLRPALALLEVDGDEALAAETVDAVERVASALPDARLRGAFARGLPTRVKASGR